MYRNSDYFIFGMGSIEGINLSIFPNFVENTVHSRIVSSPKNFFFLFNSSSFLPFQIQAYLILLNFTLLSFIDVVFYASWKFVTTPKLNKSINTTDSTAAAYFMSFCHIFIIFQSFVLLLLHLLWWSVIFDCSITIGLGYHKLCSYKMANLINKCVFSDCYTDWLFYFSPCSQCPYSLMQNNIEIRPISNLTMDSKCLS